MKFKAGQIVRVLADSGKCILIVPVLAVDEKARTYKVESFTGMVSWVHEDNLKEM